MWLVASFWVGSLIVFLAFVRSPLSVRVWVLFFGLCVSVLYVMWVWVVFVFIVCYWVSSWSACCSSCCGVCVMGWYLV